MPPSTLSMNTAPSGFALASRCALVLKSRPARTIYKARYGATELKVTRYQTKNFRPIDLPSSARRSLSENLQHVSSSRGRQDRPLQAVRLRPRSRLHLHRRSKHPRYGLGSTLPYRRSQTAVLVPDSAVVSSRCRNIIDTWLDRMPRPGS